MKVHQFHVVSAALLLGGASVAVADNITQTLPTFGAKTNTTPGNYPSRPATHLVIPFNVAGIASWDAVSDSSNHVAMLDVAAALNKPPGTPVIVRGIGWDVNLTALGASWLSEQVVYLDDAIWPDQSGVFLRPSAGSDAPGTGQFANGSGIIHFSDIGIPQLLLPNGRLRLEFHESFDDANGIPDGIWNSGILRIMEGGIVPEPAWLSALALCMGVMRRQRGR